MKEVAIMFANWSLIVINLKDKKRLETINQFLHDFDLKLDKIDYCLAIFDEKGKLIATASKYFNTIKAIAIASEYQNQQITNQLMSAIIKVIYAQHYQSVFLFSKPSFFLIFQKLGFFQIFANETFSFATNRVDLWEQYWQFLAHQSTRLPKSHSRSVVIVNANPFTNGHLYLIQQAQKLSQIVFVMVVKEESSFFSYITRYQMVVAGVQHLKNVIVLPGSEFLVSKSVFPAYFLPAKTDMIRQQATLDASIFAAKIAQQLGATMRIVGTEPYSMTTNCYNQILNSVCQEYHIQLVEIKRKSYQHRAISATLVRQLFVKGDFQQIAPLVPKTTLAILKSFNYQAMCHNPQLKKLVNKNN